MLVQGVPVLRRYLAVIHKDADHHRDLVLVDQIVERLDQLPVPGTPNSILQHGEARWFPRIVLLRHIEPVFTNRSRIDLTAPFERPLDLALRHAGL